ncbi:MAG TPA: cation diffusion facilitator family transporter [Steroidobacteraceae bacterium]|nr:cation diffusion facilitator family transporter [Steroidobacteraceae bacterium]
MSAQKGSSARAILYAFLANIGIAFAKTWAAIFTNSGSMFAEAIHSYADSVNQALLYFGLKQSQRPPNAEHPLGYAKLSYFWSFIVALLLFSVGGLVSVYEGWHKLMAPEPLSKPWVALAVLGVAVVLETFSLLGALREIRKLARGRTVMAWVRTTRNAELVVVLGEDCAALTGLALAFVFVLITLLTGNPAYDAIGSIVIGAVLIIVAIWIANRIRSLLIGRSAEEDIRSGIERIIEADPHIEELLNAITLQFGHRIMLAAKIRMQADLPIGQAVERINELERRMKAAFPEIGWCFIEPDVAD